VRIPSLTKRLARCNGKRDVFFFDKVQEKSGTVTGRKTEGWRERSGRRGLSRRLGGGGYVE